MACGGRELTIGRHELQPRARGPTYSISIPYTSTLNTFRNPSIYCSIP
jgi:hypothetical protein